MNRIDFHAHILPGIDDGAASIIESLCLLKMLKEDGVDTVVATPHLYLHRDSVNGFFRKREKSAQILAEAMKDNQGDYPKIVLGAEVYFTDGLNSLPLKELCIAGTDYLMLELPYNPFSSMFMNSFANFLNYCEVKIILAHVERYFDFNEAERVADILNYGLMAQGNCDSVVSARSRKATLGLIRNGDIKLLGTDLHSIDRRPPRFADAERIIRNKLSDGAFENMMKTAEMILNGDSEKT
ncbi:MAG: hypothetical protein LBC82_07630 [Oscillospiraceae bacterium]|jgi:protein-tyrosine phosphatase|nr:hypothetical protein [Oscillospiraceae bacterium]